LNNEINSISYTSSTEQIEQITTVDDGTTFINLQSIIPSAQPTATGLEDTGPRTSAETRPSTSTETPVTAVPKPKRKRRNGCVSSNFNSF